MSALNLTTGAYCGVETLRRATGYQDASRDSVILQHLLGASRDFDRDTLRRFFPYTGMNAYRWPPLHISASWEQWTEEDLLSVSLVQVAAAGIGAVPVTLTHYYLEPQFAGPPYNRLEVDLSSADVFQSGPTPQRSLQITGQWGYTSTTRAAGTLGAAIASPSATTITISDDTLIDQGDVLLIDSEALFVDAPRNGPLTLTVQRGVNGTTAATHLNGAPIAKYVAPADVQRVVRADAILSFQQDLASWGRVIGAGDLAVEAQGKAMQTMRQRVVSHYRRARTAAV